MGTNTTTCPFARRLVLLFDGTWNRREDTTNVWRIKMLLRHDGDQLIYYDEGVGTTKDDKFTGGAFGQGLSDKVLNGYLWLMEHYEDAQESERQIADEIYVFGFSRGAFAARSLVGLLAISGLLKRDAPMRIKDAFELSRQNNLNENDPSSRLFRFEFSRNTPVKLLAVWDTVGALGIPKIKGVPAIRLRSLEDNANHKVRELPSIVMHARHALAIDENRKIFDATLWPGNNNKQTLEQRWFVGAHANIGGGYERDGLFLRPLQWIQDEAVKLGLTFRQPNVRLSAKFYNSAPRDPLEETGYGAYFLTQSFKRYYRQILANSKANESLDYTVLQRWLWNPSYSPPSLTDILKKRPYKKPSSPAASDNEIQNLLSLANVPLKLDPTNRGYTLS